MTMSDHLILLFLVGENPAGLDAAPSEMDIDRKMLTCRHQSHLLLKQVRPRLREKKSPIGCKKFINRSDIVTTAHS